MLVNLTKLITYDIVSSPAFSGATFKTDEQMEREKKEERRKLREKKLKRLLNDFNINERSEQYTNFYQ